MRIYLSLLLFSAAILTGCQTQNSSANDRNAWSAASTQFLEARSIFTQSCAACHGFLLSWSEADFKSNGWVTAGDLNNSKVYYKLIGSTGGPNGVTKDMPQGGALTTDQVNAIQAWVQSVQ